MVLIYESLRFLCDNSSVLTGVSWCIKSVSKIRPGIVSHFQRFSDPSLIFQRRFSCLCNVFSHT